MQKMIQSRCIRKVISVFSKQEQHVPLLSKSSKSLNYCMLKYFSSNIRDNGGTVSSYISDGANNPISADILETSDTFDKHEEDTTSDVDIPVDDYISDNDEDPGFKAALSAVTPNVPPPGHVDIVPGKGPPPEPPVTCCMSGCANCVWIQYAEELKLYFTAEEGNLRAKEAIEKIENPGLQMFLKLELGLL